MLVISTVSIASVLYFVEMLATICQRPTHFPFANITVPCRLFPVSSAFLAMIVSSCSSTVHKAVHLIAAHPCNISIVVLVVVVLVVTINMDLVLLVIALVHGVLMIYFLVLLLVDNISIPIVHVGRVFEVLTTTIDCILYFPSAMDSVVWIGFGFVHSTTATTYASATSTTVLWR